MRTNTRAKHRLLILLATTGIVVAGSGGFYVYRKLAIRAEYASLRTNGLADNEAGRYEDALKKLTRYISREPKDAVVCSAIAHSRTELGINSPGAAAQVIGALSEAVRLDPTRTADKVKLCELLIATDRATEALELAGKILEVDPANIPALRTKTAALVRLRREAEALAAVNHWAEIAPNDPRAISSVLVMMSESGKSAEEVARRGAELQKRATDPNRAQLVETLVLAKAGHLAEARKKLLAIASVDPDSADMASVVATELEVLGLSDESLTYLAHASEIGRVAGGKINIARKAFEAGKPQLVIDLLRNNKPGPNDPVTELAALEALSHLQLGQADQAERIAAGLRSQNTAAAKAWVLALDLFAGKPTAPPQQWSEIIKSAMAQGEQGPVLSLVAAEAYVRQGEVERAGQVYDSLAARSKLWSLPLVRKAEMLSDSGRLEQAMAAAQEALRRAPNNAPAALTLARVWTACLDGGVRSDRAELMKLLDAIAQARPSDLSNAAARAAMLMQAKQKTKAADVIRASIAAVSGDNLSGGASDDFRGLLRMAAISSTASLGLEDAALNAYEKRKGMTPELAITKAMIKLYAGQKAEAASGFDADFAARKTDVSERDWLMCKARLYETLDKPDAGRTWIALADAYPDDAVVQRIASASRSVRADREFQARVIERLKKLTGDRGVAWRIADARLKLDGELNSRELAAVSDDLSGLVRTVPNQADVRYLLGRCLERLGSPGAAVEQIVEAVKLQPDSPGLSLYLAHLLQQRGDFARAGEQLERAAQLKLVTDDRRRAAQMLAQQGQVGKAIEMLETDATSSADSPDLLLATLYRQRSDLPRAEALATELLGKESDIGTIQFLAEVRAASGRLEEAKKTLDALDRIKLSPGVKELALAEFDLKFISPLAALEHAKKANELAPDNVATWRALMTVQAVLGKLDEAISLANEAAKRLPNEPGLKAVAGRAEAVKAAAGDPVMQPVALALFRRPDDGALLEALTTGTSGKPSEGGPSQAISRVSALADKYPLSLPIQMLSARRLLQFGRVDEAITIATRAVQSFPTSGEAAAVAAGALAQKGEWAQAVEMAKIWRQRSPVNPMAADLALCEALTQMGRHTDAATIAEPYARSFMQDPGVYTGALFSYAASLERSGRRSESVSVLESAFAERPILARRWLEYAAAHLKDEATQSWIGRLASRPDADRLEVKWALASTTLTLASRAGDASAARTSREALEALAHSPGADPAYLAQAAVAYDVANELEVAEKLYRSAMDKLPPTDRAGLQNNLAMVLVRRKGNLSEAETLVTAALGAQPSSAAYLDTLATVMIARGNYGGAVTKLSAAVELEPYAPEYRVHLAEATKAAGDAPALAVAVSQAKMIVPPGDTALRQRLASLDVSAPK